MSASTHTTVPFDREAQLHGGEPAGGPQPPSTSRRIFSGTVVRGAGELVAKTASVAFYIAIARKLGEQSFGDFIFGLSLSALLFTAAGFGTDDLVAREVAKDRRSLEGLFANVLVLKTLIIAVMLGVIALVVTVQGYPPDTRLAIMLISVGVGLEIISKTLQAVFQAYERMQYIAATLIIQRALVAAVGVAALLAGADLVAACAIFAAGGIVANVSAWFWLHRAVVQPRLKIDTSRWLTILRAGAPLGFVGTVYYALIKVDATLLSFLNGGNNAQVGHYGAAFRLIEATMFVSWAFGGAMFPWLSRREEGDGEAVSLVRGYELGLKALVAMLFPIAAFFAIYARPLIELLYGPEFGDAILPLRFLAAMTVLYGINAFIAMLMIARGRPAEFTRPALLVVVQNVIFNLILIPPLGATGAAINAVISGILLAGLTLGAAQRVFGDISIARVLVAPAVASAAMAAVAIATGISLTVGATIAGAAAYLVTLLFLERYAFPEDWGFYSGVLRLRGKASFRARGRAPSRRSRAPR